MKEVFVIREDVYGYDSVNDLNNCLLYSTIIEVCEEYLPAFKINHDFEYSYVKSIVEEALYHAKDGSFGLTEDKAHFLGYYGEKSSFGDCPEWYTPLKPRDDQEFEKRFFYYEVH